MSVPGTHLLQKRPAVVENTIEDVSVDRRGLGQPVRLLPSAELDRLQAVGGLNHLLDCLRMSESQSVCDPDRNGRSTPGLHDLSRLFVARSPYLINEGASLAGEELGRHDGQPGKRLTAGQLERKATYTSPDRGLYLETLEGETERLRKVPEQVGRIRIESQGSRSREIIRRPPAAQQTNEGHSRPGTRLAVVRRIANHDRTLRIDRQCLEGRLDQIWRRLAVERRTARDDMIDQPIEIEATAGASRVEMGLGARGGHGRRDGASSKLTQEIFGPGKNTKDRVLGHGHEMAPMRIT
jgi:hypothetical protein